MDKIVEAYDELIERALAIARAAPHFEYVEEGTARLSVQEGTAKLVWAKCDSSYGGCRLEYDSIQFEGHLLALSEQDFREWQRVQEEEYDIEQAVRIAEHERD